MGHSTECRGFKVNMCTVLYDLGLSLDHVKLTGTKYYSQAQNIYELACLTAVASGIKMMCSVASGSGFPLGRKGTMPRSNPQMHVVMAL